MISKLDKYYLYQIMLAKLVRSLMDEKYISKSKVKFFLEKNKKLNPEKKVQWIIANTKVNLNERKKIRLFFERSRKYLQLSYDNIQTRKGLKSHKNGELWETYCWSGHNRYPFPKLIDELSEKDLGCYLKRFSPKMHVAIIDKREIVFSSTKHESYESFLYKRMPLFLKEIKNKHFFKTSQTVIPIHSFQLDRDNSLKKMIKSNRIKIVKIPYPYYLLTSNRTIFAKKDSICLKLPINITITSEKRLIFQSFCHNAPIFSTIIENIIKKDKRINEKFSISSDIASVRVNDYWMAKHLCAIFREPVMDIRHSYPANHLYELIDISKNRRVLNRLFYSKFRNDKNKIRFFFSLYISVLLRGPLIIFAKYGITLEPHLQNSFIVFDNNFMPGKLILRDIDGININLDVLSKNTDISSYDFHTLTKFMFKPENISIAKLSDSLIYFHIKELIDLLVASYQFNEEFLWKKVNKEITEVLKNLVDDGISKDRVRILKKCLLSKKIIVRALISMKLSRSESFKITKIENPLLLSGND